MTICWLYLCRLFGVMIADDVLPIRYRAVLNNCLLKVRTIVREQAPMHELVEDLTTEGSHPAGFKDRKTAQRKTALVLRGGHM